MYHTITRDDRIRIKQLKELKLTNREIANLIGISERTLYYELKRGSVEQIVNSDLMTVKKKIYARYCT